jgi:hypothetical protein
VQPTGNHQVQYQPKIILYANCDALTESPQLVDDVAFRICKRWLRSSEEEGAGETYMLERLTDDAGFERGEVGSDVWQLWHGYQLACRKARLWQRGG